MHCPLRRAKATELAHVLSEHRQLVLHHPEPYERWPALARSRAHALRDHARQLALELGLPVADTMGELEHALHHLEHQFPRC